MGERDGRPPRPVEVHKFGGTSVGDGARMRRAAGLIADAALQRGVCVVSSAMAGVTNALVELAGSSGGAGRRAEILEALEARHAAALEALAVPAGDAVAVEVRGLLEELGRLSGALGAVRVTPARVRDRVVSMGERLAVRLLAAALRGEGVEAEALDADGFLETDGGFGECEPLSYTHDRRVSGVLLPLIGRGVVPVVTGFVGRGPDGDARLLGRGGSDLTASLLGAALDAEEVVIWTDVAGVFTADPRVVPEAETLEHLHFREAAEMAYFGSKVLHPRTLIPAAARGTRVSVRSTLDAMGTRTVIDGSFGGSAERRVCVSTLRAMALVSIEGGGMAGAAGVSARLFAALADAGVSVVMISQGSSESSICVAVRALDASSAESAIREAFRLDIARDRIEEIGVRGGVAIVTAVGVGMRHRVGAAATMTDALGRAGVNILAIAQGSSELSVSFAIDEDDVRAGARALHEAMRTRGVGAGARRPRLSIAVVGLGGVGRALARAAVERGRDRIVGLADSTGFVFGEGGIDADVVAEVVARKAEGRALGSADGGVASDAPALDLLTALLESGVPNAVLVDATASAGMSAVAVSALGAGVDVVTANKEVLASDAERYVALLGAQGERGAVLLGEATVGAALPLARTIETLVRSGDRVVRIEAALSGTVGFLIDRLAGTDGALSAIVEEALGVGFAEPDPRADTLGDDLRRKAVILHRLAGMGAGGDGVGGGASVRVEPFADTGALSPSDAGWRERLDAEGERVRERIAAAAGDGAVLRYVLTVDREGGPEVALRAVGADSAFAQVGVGEAKAVIWTDVHRETPLAVSGAGAGYEATAAALMGDLAVIASGRFGRDAFALGAEL